MQTCLTKFFSCTNADENYFHYAFEREAALEAKRQKEKEEQLRQLKEEERRKNSERKRLAKEKRDERQRELREAREEMLRNKYEALEVLPGVYLGSLSPFFSFVFHYSNIQIFILTIKEIDLLQ
jgi:DNA repair exonuclease SbcCD nuclease subunit